MTAARGAAFPSAAAGWLAIAAVGLAALVLGETVSAVQALGGVLILTAVVVLAQAGRPAMVPEEAPPA